MKPLVLLAGAAAALVLLEQRRKPSPVDVVPTVTDCPWGSCEDPGVPDGLGDGNYTDGERTLCADAIARWKRDEARILGEMLEQDGFLLGHPAVFCARHDGDARCTLWKTVRACAAEEGVAFNKSLPTLVESIGDGLKWIATAALGPVGSVLWVVVGAGVVYLVVTR